MDEGSIVKSRLVLTKHRLNKNELKLKQTLSQELMCM